MKNIPGPRDEGQKEGERSKDAAHSVRDDRREVLTRRAWRALLRRVLIAKTATADAIAEIDPSAIEGLDPRWRGNVPKPLALAGIISDTGRTVKSSRPEAHARKITVWELGDRAAALAWLARNPDLPNPEPIDDAGQP